MADRAPPLAKILARRKDAPKGEKGHSTPILAIWTGEFRNTATLDESVAFIQLVDGSRITQGRESEHWLNVYDREDTPRTSAPLLPKLKAPLLIEEDDHDDSTIPF